MGFSGLGDEKKLQFDLTQGVRVTTEFFTTRTTAAAVAAAPPVPVAAVNVSSPALDVSMSIRTESGLTTHHQAESSTTATITTPSAKRLSLFKLPVVASPGGARKAGMTPAEYSTVEFEMRVVSYSDDDDDRRHGSGNSHWRSKRAGGDDDESWMDILVATQDCGIGRQEAEFSARGRAKAIDMKRRVWRLCVRSRVCLIRRGRRTMRADRRGILWMDADRCV